MSWWLIIIPVVLVVGAALAMIGIWIWAVKTFTGG